jgi:hypothetical protein
LVIERAAAIDVAKATGKVCVRLPGKAGRRVSRVWDVSATTGAVADLAGQGFSGQQTEKPPTRRVVGGFCVFLRLGRAANASLEQHFALGLRQAAPDAVGLPNSKRVSAALRDDGALATHLLGPHLALRAGPATLAVRMEEHTGVDAPTQARHLPIPDVRIGSG